MSELPNKPPAVPEQYLTETLNLPDGKGFHPVHWNIPLEVILRLSEERLPMINGRPGAANARLARMTGVPFRF